MAISERMNRCIETCLACYKTCLGTAMNHCLVSGGKHVEPAHFRLMMACAEMCRTAAHFISTPAASARKSVPSVPRIASGSAQWTVGAMDECVAMCRACAESWRAMPA